MKHNDAEQRKAREIAECEREVAILELHLAKTPTDTRNWVLRSEIYQHLQSLQPLAIYTTEQLYFGAFVAGLSTDQTRKSAHYYSFLATKDRERRERIAKDLQEDAE